MSSRHQLAAMEQHFSDVPVVARMATIIAAALIAGEFVFTGIVLFTSWNEPPGDIVAPIVLAGMAVMELPILLVVAPIVTKNRLSAVRDLDAFSEKPDVCIANVYFTQMIIMFALLEGAVFGNLIGFMIGHHVWSLGIAGAFMFVQFVLFPSRHRIENWIEEQKRKYELGEVTE